MSELNAKRKAAGPNPWWMAVMELADTLGGDIVDRPSLRWLRKADPALRRRLLAATGLLSALIGAALLMENAPTVLASRLG